MPLANSIAVGGKPLLPGRHWNQSPQDWLSSSGLVAHSCSPAWQPRMASCLAVMTVVYVIVPVCTHMVMAIGGSYRNMPVVVSVLNSYHSGLGRCCRASCLNN